MYETTDFRKGLWIEYRDQPWTIVEFQHVNPGKGSAFVRTKLKNLETAQVLDVTFKAGVDRVGIPDVEAKTAQFLYKNADEYTFMDSATFDQFVIKEQELGDNIYFIIEGSNVKVMFYRGKPVTCEVDNFIKLKVAEAQPNIKGDTSSGSGKPITLETGLTITAPFHINKGDVVKIDTRTSSYVEKVNEKVK